MGKCKPNTRRTHCGMSQGIFNPFFQNGAQWYGSGGESPGIQVTFEQAGTGSALASIGNLTPSYPVTGNLAGDIFFLHVAIRNITTVFETPTGWTLVSTDFDTNNAGNAWVFYKVSDGTESGNLTITTTGDAADPKLARIYRFRGSPGTRLFGEQSTAQNLATTLVSAPTVVSIEPNSLAVCFTYEADNVGIPDFTGETGGDWTQPVAAFSTALGADSLLAIHTAVMASPGTISGGSSTMIAGASTVSRAFALSRTSIPATAVQSGRLYAITLSQSNGNGQASVSDIAAAGRPELTQDINRSWVWWQGDNGVGWQPLQAGVNGNTLGNAYFGPIISMAYAEDLKYPNVDKFYVIHAVGGSTMAAWTASLTDFFLAKYRAALQKLTPTVFVGVATFHGESDSAVEAASLAYEAAEDVQLTKIFANTGFTDAFVLQLHDFLPAGSFPYDANVRTAKTNNDTNGNYGTNGGLAPAPTGSVIQGDNVHYNALGVITAGDNISVIMP